MSAVVICIATRERLRPPPRVHYCCVCGRAPVAEVGSCRTCKMELAMVASLTERGRKRIAEWNESLCACCHLPLDGAVAFDASGNLVHPGCQP